MDLVLERNRGIHLISMGVLVAVIGIGGYLIGFTSVYAMALPILFGLVIVMNIEQIHQILNGITVKFKGMIKKE